MPLWDKVRQELDNASRIARHTFDEGRLRLDLFRARQNADRFAQRLGYAVHEAQKRGEALNPDELSAHTRNLSAAEAEIKRLETMIAEAQQRRRDVGVLPRNTQPPGAA